MKEKCDHCKGLGNYFSYYASWRKRLWILFREEFFGRARLSWRLVSINSTTICSKCDGQRMVKVERPPKSKEPSKSKRKQLKYGNGPVRAHAMHPGWDTKQKAVIDRLNGYEPSK